MAFVRQLGELRVGVGNPYLVFGTMLRPLPIVVDDVSLEWTHHNRPHHEPFEAESGLHNVPEVFHAAWRAPDGAIGLFFVNLHDPADGALAIDLPLSTPGDHHHTNVTVTTTRGDGPPIQRSNAWRPTLTLDLPPRVVVLVDISGTGVGA
ncbi:MAG: hypothetical protein H0V37_03490 [Chloroflexia bacterium]|nr:hypothetical protein [Chloroflexia bacterium]